jgi:hypothetical protein
MNYETITVTFIAGILGGGVSSLITAIRQHCRERDRKKILKILLNDKNKPWRKLETLSRVIGLDKERTKELLIDINKRYNYTHQQFARD